MSRRDQIRMTDEEVGAFLLEGPHKLQVATINRDGSPHLVAMYYAVVDGRIAFWTYTKSQKIRNLERDPRITVLVEDGLDYAELRGVQIAGTATLSTDPAAVLDIGERLHARYWGELDDTARAGVAYSGRKRTRVEVEPLRVVSWDHRKLGGTY